MRRTLVLSACGVALMVVLASPAPALGHHTAVYVSTPISPPKPFVWVLPAFVLTTATAGGVATLLLLRRKRRWRAFVFSALSVLVFWFCSYGFGRMAAEADTVPPPGLGPPSSVLWGLGWRDVGGLFLRWNIYGLLFLVVASAVSARVAGLRHIHTCLAVVGVNVIVYAAFLVPYVAQGAFSHGWTGGYVEGECERQVCQLGSGLLHYARAHDGRLPASTTVAGVFDAVRPYLDRPESPRRHDPITICSVLGTFEADPEPYAWNAALAGQRVADLDRTQPQWVIRCPYHRL